MVLDEVAAGLAQVEEEEDAGVQVCEGADRLHLDGVHLFYRVVQNSRGVYHLPVVVQLVAVTYLERLCGEGLVLHVHVGTCDRIHER